MNGEPYKLQCARLAPGLGSTPSGTTIAVSALFADSLAPGTVSPPKKKLTKRQVEQGKRAAAVVGRKLRDGREVSSMARYSSVGHWYSSGRF